MFRKCLERSCGCISWWSKSHWKHAIAFHRKQVICPIWNTYTIVIADAFRDLVLFYLDFLIQCHRFLVKPPKTTSALRVLFLLTNCNPRRDWVGRGYSYESKQRFRCMKCVSQFHIAQYRHSVASAIAMGLRWLALSALHKNSKSLIPPLEKPFMQRPTVNRWICRGIELLGGGAKNYCGD